MKITPTGIYNNKIYCTIIMKDNKRISISKINQAKKYINEAREREEKIDFRDVKKVSDDCSKLLELLK